MNRKNAEEYIKDAMALKIEVISNTISDNWPLEYKNHFEKFPKKLYKYAKVNKNYIDSIKNNYIYLCPANKLDDQFECRINFAIKKISKNPKLLLTELTKGLANLVADFPNPIGKNKTKKIIENSLNDNNELNYEKMKSEITNTDPSIDECSINTMIDYCKMILNTIENTDATSFLDSLITKAYEANSNMGIGSLTENNKSQVMWEMYGNNYKGICIEYDFSYDIKAMFNILPVIYKKKNNKNFILILVDIILNIIISHLSNGKFGNSNSLKKYVEPFFTKYSEWSFQDEWRVIGKASDKFFINKIKSIYLGKNIAKSNKEKIIKIARKKGIALFEQIDDLDSLSIKYQKIKI